MIYIIGPGHGGPGMVAQTYLEGSYTEIYPDIEQNGRRNQEVVQAVFFSGWDSEPCAGDAGVDSRRRRVGVFALHAYGAASTIPTCRRLRGGGWRGGDRALRDQLALEQVSESGEDGAVLPILHLNGYKIAEPTVLARIRGGAGTLFRGYGYKPYFLEGTSRR